MSVTPATLTRMPTPEPTPAPVAGVSVGAANVGCAPSRDPEGSDLTATPVEALYGSEIVWTGERLVQIVAVRRLPTPATATWVEVDVFDFPAPEDYAYDQDNLYSDGPEPLEWSFPVGAVLDVVETAYFYLSAEEGLNWHPNRLTEATFTTRYRPRVDADGIVVVETPDPTIADNHIWSHIEYDEGGHWRDYVLVPGYHREGINYVITDTPWTDPSVEVDWN